MMRVLTADLDHDTLEALQTRAANWGVDFEHQVAPAVPGRLREAGSEVLLLVVGTSADPIRTLQRAHMAAPRLPVIVVGSELECATLTERLRFSALVGPDIQCLPGRPTTTLLEEIKSTLDRSRRREAHRHTIRALNQKLGDSMAEIQPAETILGRLLDVAPIGIVVTNEAGHIQALNPRAEHFFLQPAIGRPLWEGFCRGDWERLEALLKRFNGDPKSQPLEIVSLGDPPRQIEITGTRLYSQWGSGYLVLLQDVTERLDLVAQLRAANRRKDEFLAMLSHELRNPLAPIRTALEIMRLRGTPGAEHEREIIERQVSHLLELVNDLLDVSRITRGQLSLRKDLVEVSDFVAEAIEMGAPLLEQKQHQLSVEVPREGLRVDGDPVRLAQVVANLLTNAAKYTPPGGRVLVTAFREGQQIVISVRDTGMGIEPDLLPHIFDLFVQKGQSIDRATGGLGIGLPIVNGLVKMHGGSVSVSSTVGQGSEFTVRLPTGPANRKHGREHRNGPVVEAGGGPSDAEDPSTAGMNEKFRILIVDDNEDAALLLSNLLQAFGFTTAIAHDGPSGLAVARQFVPDLALVDIGLPVMDGYELAGRLRAIPELQAVHLIAVTGYGTDADRQRSRIAGFSEHLVKPINIDTLSQIIERLKGSSSEAKR